MIEQDSEGDIIDSICDELALLRDRVSELVKCREYALAITKLEEAGMWLQQGKHREP